jgi:hypothetical protein
MKNSHSLAEQIKAYIEMIWLNLFKKITVQSREPTSSASRWIPPPEGMVYINVDATVFSSSSRMGVGIVIGDHNSNCLIAFNQQLDKVTMPELAEALAVRCVVALAHCCYALRKV